MFNNLVMRQLRILLRVWTYLESFKMTGNKKEHLFFNFDRMEIILKCIWFLIVFTKFTTISKKIKDYENLLTIQVVVFLKYNRAIMIFSILQINFYTPNLYVQRQNHTTRPQCVNLMIIKFKVLLIFQKH